MIVALLATFIAIFAVIVIVGFLSALPAHPWLMGFVGLAIISYTLAKRAERREKGDSPKNQR